MNTDTKAAGIPPEILEDHRAVMRHVNQGTPVDPELAKRVRERSEQLTAQLLATYGEIDSNALLHSVRDE
jgi:hypothetical protein